MNTASTATRTGVLFVCLGNICRSPIAEGVFIHLARERRVLDRFHVDSAGTGGWHAGERADPRARAVALRHGVELPSVARRIDCGYPLGGADQGDLARFHWFIAMDRRNLRDMLDAGCPTDRTRLLRSFDPELNGKRVSAGELDVPDPYSAGDAEFLAVYRMVLPACNGLLEALLAGDAR